ncbi:MULTISPECIES: hypothetical protein [unclassified Pseudoclavibacter]|uniref:hypothetical protein n=1 Tax=unclassified Pseudoclavibacter TaxID=2615177 RepID=UPI001BA63418|nr:hypothetical protein [Pseudoclavibacter sp. Marseille-Q4354]MBS3180031.1 hypothetical protein [Pseudoclavibacter sp. Marseille-Q4354]
MRKNTLSAVTAAALAALTLAGCTTADTTTTTAPSATATAAPTDATAAAPTGTAEAEARIPVVVDGAGSASLGAATIDIRDSTLILTDASGLQLGPTIPVELAGEVAGPVTGDIAWFTRGDAGIDAIGGHFWDDADTYHRVEILEAGDAPALPTDEVPETNTTLVVHADPAAWDGLGAVDSWIYGPGARGSLKLSIVD